MASNEVACRSSRTGLHPRIHRTSRCFPALLLMSCGMSYFLLTALSLIPIAVVHDIMSSEAGPFQAIRGESGHSDITYVFV